MAQSKLHTEHYSVSGGRREGERSARLGETRAWSRVFRHAVGLGAGSASASQTPDRTLHRPDRRDIGSDARHGVWHGQVPE